MATTLGVLAENVATRTQRRVILRVWGFATADVRHIEHHARQLPRAHSWNIVEVIPSIGAPCPIPVRDPLALDQAAEYDVAWAVYPADSVR